MFTKKKNFDMPYTEKDRFFDVMSYICRLFLFYGVMLVGLTRLKGYFGCLVFSIGLVSALYLIYDWLLLNFTEKYKVGEISKLRDTFLVRNREGYIYFKKKDIIAATIETISDANYILELKLKQCYFYRCGLFNCGYIVLNSKETKVSQCNPAEYLNVLYSLPLDRYELKYDPEEDFDDEDPEKESRIVVFTSNDLAAEMNFANIEDCEDICAHTLEVVPEQVVSEPQNAELQNK